MADGFVTDAELLRALHIPEKVGYVAIAELERQTARGVGAFPRKDPLFGNRRYMPAVRRWLENRYGMTSQSLEAPDGPENLSHGPKNRERPRLTVAQTR